MANIVFLIEYKKKNYNTPFRIPIEASSEKMAREQFYRVFPKCVKILSIKKIQK